MGIAWLRAPLIVASEGWLVGRRHAVDVFDDFRKKMKSEILRLEMIVI